MTITDRDREAGDTLIRTWLRDRDPKGLTQRVIEAIAQAREEGRREEREAIINDLAITTRYSLCGDNGIVPSMGGDYMDVRETFDTIRARGED